MCEQFPFAVDLRFALGNGLEVPVLICDHRLTLGGANEHAVEAHESEVRRRARDSQQPLCVARW